MSTHSIAGALSYKPFKAAGRGRCCGPGCLWAPHLRRKVSITDLSGLIADLPMPRCGCIHESLPRPVPGYARSVPAPRNSTSRSSASAPYRPMPSGSRSCSEISSHLRHRTLQRNRDQGAHFARQQMPFPRPAIPGSFFRPSKELWNSLSRFRPRQRLLPGIRCICRYWRWIFYMI